MGGRAFVSHWHISVILDNVISAIELCCFKLIKIRPIGYFECKCTCSETETDEIFCCIEQGYNYLFS